MYGKYKDVLVVIVRQTIKYGAHQIFPEKNDTKLRSYEVPVKAGFHMIADRNKVCDRLRSCDRDRRRSQKIEPCSISCDRLRSIAIVCDLRSAIIWKPNQPLDRTWFYLLRSSAITIAGSQTLLRSAIIWKPAFSFNWRLQKKFTILNWSRLLRTKN